MKAFPDPQHLVTSHVKQAEARYVAWLRRGGVEPNEILMQEHRSQALQEAKDACLREINDIHHHNMKLLLREHQKRLNQIKRNSSWRRWLMGLPIALLLGLLSWYCFHQAVPIMGTIFAVGALACLAMLLLGVMVDRPRRLEG